MTYRVLWAPHAEENLAKVLNESPDLAAVARQIDAHLMKRPKSFGESRFDWCVLLLSIRSASSSRLWTTCGL
jgi:hypothetical protein